MKILFLAVNPPTLNEPLRLDEETRAIDQVLRRSETGRTFDIEQHWAVRVGDLQELLLRHSPQIVHFSGHGTGEDGLIFEDEQGNPQLVPPQALARLFAILKGNIRCVVLNACFSVDQAEGIAEHIEYVIGMNAKIHDLASISFARAFYQALGYKRSIETAFELGKSQLALDGLEDASYPELFFNPNRQGASGLDEPLLNPSSDIDPTNNPSTSSAPLPASVASSGDSGAIALWREKLEFLREQEVLATDAAQKFALKKQIEEAEAKIRGLS